MTPSAQAPEAAPAAVREALLRAASLVEREGGGWSVGGTPAGAGGEALAEGLYGGWYVRPAVPAGRCGEDPPLQRRSLASAFRAAHAGAARTSAGWTVMTAGGRGAVSAVRGEAARALRPGEYVMPLRSGAPVAPGEPVEPLARLDHLDAELGIWWAFTDPGPEAPKGRLYLDVRPPTAPRAVHEVTTALEGIPYQLKCPVLSEACERVDALVVYHRRSQREEAIAALLNRWPRLGPLLDPAVPPLTCQVRPGLAWADDVEAERSYGETRCHALAAAIEREAAAWSAGAPDARLRILLAGLRAAGIDPSRPWEASG